MKGDTMANYKEVTKKFYGRYGGQHFRYLLENNKNMVDDLLIKNELENYLLLINKQALELKDNIIQRLKIEYNLMPLQETNYLEFLRVLNTIESIAEEIVLNDIIYV